MRSLFEISKSGLRSAERSLSVTSNNITNADTPGYTRQRVEKTPNGMQMSGSHTGLGVNITHVNRLRNEMNDQLMNEKRQNMSYMQSKSSVYEQLEATMVSESGSDLDLSISSLLDAFSELSTDPQDMSVRNSLVSEAQELSTKFQDLSRNIDRNSELVRESAAHTVNEVNNLIQEINSLNNSISQSEGAGDPDNAALDLRVRKLEELSELIDFSTHQTDNGEVEILIDGVKILSEDNAEMLKAEINDVDKEFRLRIGSGKLVHPTEGQLGGQIEMYQEQIPALKDRLDELATTIVKEFNDLHLQGFGLEDSSARNFFDPDISTAAQMSVNQAIIDNPAHVAASDIDGEAGNGSIATQIADLRNESVLGGRKLIDYSVDLISTPGARVDSLRSQMEARDSEIQMLQNQQEREAGVNIDEELSLMIQYQNAYQGAAKVMQAAQNMYDTLIGILR